MQDLDERKRKILKAIIQTYLETGEPVGSRTISKYTDLNLSSATIRNEMSDLEDLGYIVQPHTSAGRIPSDLGYRLYVDELMKEKDQGKFRDDEMIVEKTNQRWNGCSNRWSRCSHPIRIMRHSLPVLPIITTK